MWAMTTALPHQIARGVVLLAILLSACGGGATVPPPPPPPVLTTMTVALSVSTIQVGQTSTASASGLDQNSAAIAVGSVTWSSSASGIATVNASGSITGIAPGQAAITGQAGGKLASQLVTVIPIPVARVVVEPASPTLAIGSTQQLSATTYDANNNVLTGHVVTWSTSDHATVTVDATGLATAVATGSATINATSDGVTGRSTVTVSGTPGTVVITTVAPSTLVPGSTFTITGTGFSATAGSDTVTVGGVVAVVASASTTQVIGTVPCLVSGTVPVAVTIGVARSNVVNSSLVGTTQTLAVGQSVALLTEASVRCNELPVTGGRYLISVFNTSTAPSANTPVVIKGAAVAAGTNGPAPAISPLKALKFAQTARQPLSPEAAARAANARAHATILERNRTIFESAVHNPGYQAALSAARTRVSASALAVPLTVGSNVTLRYGGFTSSGCNTFSNVTARVVAVTTHSIVLEDNASPTAGQVDADLSALGQLFESTLYPIEANFGDINAWDTPGSLDNPGRVLMLFTPQENQPFPGGGILLGHVSSCDLIPAALSGFAGSNQTKIFYARVPTSLTGTAYTLDTRAWWNANMPGTLVHEAKHITSNAERLSRNATVLEESWLEEATAQIAPEIYSRTLYAGTTWKGNTTYLNSLYCDFRIGTAQCPTGKVLMTNHFNFLLDYYENNEVKSILSAETIDPDILGSGWMFVRWLVDQYGGGTESTLLRSLVQEANLTGVANVTAKTGVPFANLLADWTMTLVADDYPGFTPAVGAKYTFPSWNTRSIWAGFNTDFGSVDPAFPLEENSVTFGSFSLSGTLPGAAAGIIELSGSQSAKQLLDLSSLAAGTTIRMSILRVQ